MRISTVFIVVALLGCAPANRSARDARVQVQADSSPETGLVELDAGSTDAARAPDLGPASAADLGPDARSAAPDLGALDAGQPADLGAPDLGPPDAGPTDTGPRFRDLGRCQTLCLPPNEYRCPDGCCTWNATLCRQ